MKPAGFGVSVYKLGAQHNKGSSLLLTLTCFSEQGVKSLFLTVSGSKDR